MMILFILDIVHYDTKIFYKHNGGKLFLMDALLCHINNWKRFTGYLNFDLIGEAAF